MYVVYVWSELLDMIGRASFYPILYHLNNFKESKIEMGIVPLLAGSSRVMRVYDLYVYVLVVVLIHTCKQYTQTY